MAKRVLVFVNKGFEADPLAMVLLSERGAPREDDLGVVSWNAFPSIRKKERRKTDFKPTTDPMLVVDCRGTSIEVRCIEDMMNPAVSSSSTAEKARVLGALFAAAPKPDFVIAIGTASTPTPKRFNGSVVIGSRVFVHDPFSGAATGGWLPPQPDEVIESAALPKNFFRELDEDARFPAEGRFLAAPVRSARPARIVAGNAFVSVGIVNVTNYDDYAWADPQALNAFAAKTKGKLRIGSIETTHGVIRAFTPNDVPFLFVSGIANGTLLFDYETTPRVYTQNFVASHNAGVALAWLLPQLAETLVPKV